MSALKNLSQLGFELSPPPAAAANYVPLSQAAGLLFISGQISSGPDGLIKGTLGDGLSTQDGQKAAAQCALNLLSHIKFSAGYELDTVRFVKLTVLVASAPRFYEQHLVANGASDLLVKVLGDHGRHARAAFGVASLPLGAAVEIEAVVEPLR